jgi:gentisate 1,2-dioxygenase
MPTIAMHMQRMPAGFRSRRYRTTANQIFCVRSGSGSADIHGVRFAWQPGDVFVVPTWHDCALEVDEEAVLFRASDEKMQRALRFYRDEDVPVS